MEDECEDDGVGSGKREKLVMFSSLNEYDVGDEQIGGEDGEMA